MPDLFPATPCTWIDVQLELGDHGSCELIHGVLSIYFEPLCGYVRASSLRELGDADDIVTGFLVSRLSRPDYIRRWRAQGNMPLRRWLMNGLLLYGRELRRQRSAQVRREARGASIEGSAGPERGAEAAMEKHWALRVVRRACADVEAELQTSGRGEDWYIFRRHFLDGLSYRELFKETGVEPARAAVRSHTILKMLRQRIRAILLRDGTPPDRVDEEIARLQRVIDEWRSS